MGNKNSCSSQKLCDLVQPLIPVANPVFNENQIVATNECGEQVVIAVPKNYYCFNKPK